MKVEAGLEGGTVCANWHDFLMAKRHLHQSETNKSSLEQAPVYLFLFYSIIIFELVMDMW